MLTTKVFSSSSNAQKYYSHDDYYGNDANGLWFGQGAKELWLEGRFNGQDNKEFKKILDGVLQGGTRLGRLEKDGKVYRCPGMDLTFSSPKSFSIQMLIFASREERAKLEQARLTAVQNTLKYIERSGLIYARKGKNGVVHEEINKLTFALFAHTTNRNLEPQDHVHCLLANIAKCSDGKYRSISWDRILENHKFLGQIFRNELAIEVKKLGYEIETKILPDGSSSFELKSIAQKLIDAFSTRRQEIEELCKELGIKTKEGRDRVVITSRKAKQTVEKEKLIKAWQEVVKAVALEKESINRSPQPLTVESAVLRIKDFLIEKFNILNPPPENILELNTDSLARLCLADVSYHNSVFSKNALSAKALKYSIGRYSIGDVEAGIQRLIDKKEIITGKEQQLTCKELLDKEKYILKAGKQGLNKYAAIIDKSYFKKRFGLLSKDPALKQKLNQDQIKAVHHILTSKDKITAIQGLPGVGKSTVLDTVRQMSMKTVVSLLGAAPTASASRTLEESAGIVSGTLHSFVGKYKGYLEGRGTKEGLIKTQTEFKKSLIFVDEASLISTRMMYNLLKLSEILKFRVVLIGDIKQLASIEAGKPFEQLLDVIKSVKLTTILRQQEDSHKEAIKLAANNNVLSAFKILEKNIKQAGDEIVPQAVQEFMSLSKTERENTLLISPTRIMRDEINRMIVDQLKKEDLITGPKYIQNILKQKDFTKADCNFAKSYETGDVVKFYNSYKSLGIERGDYLEVKKIFEHTNTITFKKGLRDIRFNLKQDIDYESKYGGF
jgi:conjugative relaxase-like TrwC/TraI family protein